MASHDVLVEQLRELGVSPGQTLLVHSSFRAVRPVEGGPLGLIQALESAIGPDGTLVMPAWTGDDAVPYSPTQTSSLHLGVLTDTFWRQPGVLRSSHAEAFAAKGPLAERVVSGPLPLPPHIPDSAVGKVAELDGWVLLLGVGHDANTTVHLAELLAHVPYGLEKQVTVDGRVVQYRENDHCCARFDQLDAWLGERQHEGRVGNAEARLMRARDVLDVAVAALKRDPTVFLHPRGSGCEECDEAWESIR